MPTCNVGLDEREAVAGVAIEGADDTRRNRGIESERRTDGQNPLSFLERGRIPDRQRFEAFGVYLDQGHVGARISAYDLGLVLLARCKRNEDAVGLGDHIDRKSTRLNSSH